MFHTTPTPYTDMTAAAVATVNSASNAYHQSPTAGGNTTTPVYVPSSRALPHSAQYAGAHAANFHSAQNGWGDVNFCELIFL